ncbi:unnamed protein product [Phytomonas sp. Hart1]|nr:unnamed protein product [Phytomonas sp. Hart1]|eukprot:CCW68439.1 unnamed protein product [Phytomonas sp. isolate Hart1]
MVSCSEEVTLKNLKLHSSDLENFCHAESGSTVSSMRRRRGCIESRDRNPPVEWETAIRNLNMMQLENREKLNGSLQRESSMRSITSQGIQQFNNLSIIIPHDMLESSSPMPRNPSCNMRPPQSSRDRSTTQGIWVPHDDTISTTLEKKEFIQSVDSIHNTINTSKPSYVSLQYKWCASPDVEQTPHSKPKEPSINGNNHLIENSNRGSSNQGKTSPKSSVKVEGIQEHRNGTTETGRDVNKHVVPTLIHSGNHTKDSRKGETPDRTDAARCPESMQSKSGNANLQNCTISEHKLDSPVELISTPTPRAKVSNTSQSPSIDPVMRRLDPNITTIPALTSKPDNLVVSPCSIPIVFNLDKKPKRSPLRRESAGPRKEFRAVSTLKYGTTPRRTGSKSVGVPHRTPRTCGEEKGKPILLGGSAFVATSNNFSRISGSDGSDPKTASTQNTIKDVAKASVGTVANPLDRNIASTVFTTALTENTETTTVCKPQVSCAQRKIFPSTLAHSKNISSSPPDTTKITPEESDFPVPQPIVDPTSDKKQSGQASAQRCQKGPLIYRTTALSEQRRRDSVRIRCERKKEEEDKANTLASSHGNFAAFRADKCMSTRESSVQVPAKRPAQRPLHTTLVIQPSTTHVTTQKKPYFPAKVAEVLPEGNKEVSSAPQCLNNPLNNIYLDPKGLPCAEGKQIASLNIVKSARKATTEAAIPVDNEGFQPGRTPRCRTLVPFCIQCGKRHICDTARFCAFCGHKRESV